VGELHARGRALLMEEPHDARERQLLLVVVQAGVRVADAPFGLDCRRLGEDESRAAEREASEVHEVPVVGNAALRRVLAHGRDHDAILEGELAELERLKKRRSSSRHGDLAT
jgi:hypothetical protein